MEAQMKPGESLDQWTQIHITLKRSGIRTPSKVKNLIRIRNKEKNDPIPHESDALIRNTAWNTFPHVQFLYGWGKKIRSFPVPKTILNKENASPYGESEKDVGYLRFKIYKISIWLCVYRCIV